MKKTLFFFAVCFCLATLSFGQVSFGVGGTYVDDFGVQARANMDVSDGIGVIPSVSYYFVDGATALSVDANLTYDLTTVGDDMPIYALAGIDWTRISIDGIDASNSEFGINIGAGTNIGNIYGEVFYRKLFCDGCGGDIGLNVGYNF
jgi:hypothetical protein